MKVLALEIDVKTPTFVFTKAEEEGGVFNMERV